MLLLGSSPPRTHPSPAHCPGAHISTFLGSSWLDMSSPWPRQPLSPLPHVKTALSAVVARLWLAPADTATTRFPAKASIFLGGYSARGAQRCTWFPEVPEDVALTELEHYDVIIDVVRRVEVALGDDPAAANSLTQGYTRAREFFSERYSLVATRQAAINAVRSFEKRMHTTMEESWVKPFASTKPLELLPSSVIPTTSDCFSSLIDSEQRAAMLETVVIALPAVAAQAGIDTSNMSYPAGMRAAAASNSDDKRPRSRSASPARRGYDGGDAERDE